MTNTLDFLIVEDELLIAETISEILINAGYSEIRKVDSLEDAIKEIEIKKPKLILTDIALGKKKTGLDLGELLNTQYHIPFIYITSHASKEILSKAKHTHPNAYIVKPFKNEDLLVAVEFALFNSENTTNTTTEEINEIIIKEGRAILKIDDRDIKWLEVDGNYTSIILRNSKRRVVRSTISELESQLDKKKFIRIHKSYLVNKLYVSEVRATCLFINEQEFPIGRTYQTSTASYFHIS